MSVSRPHGFAGLETLVSDVAGDLADAERLARSQGSTAKSASSPPTRPPVVRARLAGIPLGGKWALGIGIAILALWLVDPARVNTPTTRPNQAPAPSPPSERFSGEPPRVDPPPNPAPAPRPPASAAQFLVKPPIGQGLILDIGQIRYCLAEEIRLEIIDPLVDTKVKDEVERFNARADDYNRRCSQYRYKRGTLEQARAEVESQRSTIERLARLEWKAGR